MKGFRVWSDYWKKYATEAELHMDGSADAVFEDDGGVPHHDNADLVVEIDTGLKDKNGKEIYVGDIVKDTFHVCEVKWLDDFCRAIVTNENEGYLSDVWYMAKYGEVIGNIHENSELLKEEE